MPLKIFLTSDLHIGMKFAGYPDAIQESLVNARFETLANLVDRANASKCDLFMIAGDLFDRVTIAKKDIVKAAQILSDFQGHLVAILPGNHDYVVADESDLWAYFDDHKGDNVLVIKKQEVIPLARYDLEINLYPGPCSAKHSAENAIEWINEVEKDLKVKYHIGVAHGSLEGFSPDFQKTYYPMSVKELKGYKLDLWMLGHTHVQYPTTPGTLDKIFFPATPEPDGFDCNHEGKAWILSLDDNKKIAATSLSMGTYRFLHEEMDIGHTEDIEALQKRYSASDYNNVLLKLKIQGRLPEEDVKMLSSAREAIDKTLFFLQWDTSQVTQEITPTDINKMFTEDSFPHRLLMELSNESEDFEALQEAYELIKEIKE